MPIEEVQQVEAIEKTVDDTAAVVLLEGELDAADLSWAQALNDAIDGGRVHVVADMLNVTFIDSSVIREIVLAHKRLLERDGWLRLVYTHHLIARVVDICGLAETFPQYPTVDAALRRGRKEG